MGPSAGVNFRNNTFWGDLKIRVTYEVAFSNFPIEKREKVMQLQYIVFLGSYLYKTPESLYP
jgi:hypothetical protein